MSLFPVPILESAVKSVGSSVLHAALNPTLYEVSSTSWWSAPNVRPPSDSLIQAWQRGMLSEEDVTEQLLRQGVTFLAGNTRMDREKRSLHMRTWESMAELMLSRPDASALTHAYISKRISEKEYRKGMMRSGADGEDWLRIATMYHNLPSVEQSMMARQRGMLSPQQWKKAIELQGGRECDWFPLLDMYQTYPTVGELIVARNRGIIQPGWFDGRLKLLGFESEVDRETIDKLREVLPTYSDLVTMQRRDVFNPTLALSLGLYDEQPVESKEWFKKQGLFGGPGFPITSDGKERDADWIDLLWGMSWRRLSPTETFEAVRRLRPGRVDRWVKGLKEYLAPVLNGEVQVDAATLEEARKADEELDKLKPFTVADAFKELRVADWPKQLRPLLLALTFTPLRLIDIRNAYLSGARDRKWFIEQQLDRGIAPDDAETLADIQDNASVLALRRKNLALTAQASSNFIRSSMRAYQEGIIDRATAKNTIEIWKIDESTAELMLNTVDLEARTKLSRKAINTIGKQYVSGEWNRDEAIGHVQALGINNERAIQYVSLWDMERTKTRRQLTTAKIQKYVAEGLLDTDNAIRRLENLGWSNADRLLLLSEAQAIGTKNRQRELAAQDRDKRAAAAQVEKALEDTEKEIQRLQAELRRHTPPTKLQAWLKKGVIGEEYFNRRMARMGYPEGIIRRYRVEAIGNGQETTNGTD